MDRALGLLHPPINWRCSILTENDATAGAYSWQYAQKQNWFARVLRSWASKAPAMPRYRFDLRDAGAFVNDGEGMGLPNVEDWS